MFSSGDQSGSVELVTVGFLDPLTDRPIEYDFIGREIAGRYVVREHIGGGGMADVFRAADQKLGIDVAIKLLKPRLASPEMRARMVQEAQAAAQVRHPNLVRVFGTDSLDGTAFIVMELFTGQNLEQHLRERPGQRLPCDEALALLLPALHAVHAVHLRGYIHRDIKAGNILVTEDPDGGALTAVVIDLGLVKPDRALRTVSSPPTTEVGRLLCTPAYISPEQAFGRPVDRRSDVYSMAVTLYRALTGRLPFPDARAVPVEVVLAHHLYTPAPPLAEAAPDADIPPAVAAVVEAALAKDPAERPQTMRAFARALSEAQAGVHGEAHTGPVRRAGAATPRHRLPWGQLLLGVHLLLLAGVLGGALLWPSAPGPRCPPLPGAAARTAGAPEPEPGEMSMLAPMMPEPAPGLISWPGSEPALGAGLEDRSSEAPGPEMEAASARDPTRRAVDRGERARRALQREVVALGPKFAACHHAHGGARSLRVQVEVVLDRRGRLERARVVEPTRSPETLCMTQALRGLPVAPAIGPAHIVHTFDLPARSTR